jgi:hypothetical protein
MPAYQFVCGHVADWPTFTVLSIRRCTDEIRGISGSHSEVIWSLDQHPFDNILKSPVAEDAPEMPRGPSGIGIFLGGWQAPPRSDHRLRLSGQGIGVVFIIAIASVCLRVELPLARDGPMGARDVLRQVPKTPG